MNDSAKTEAFAKALGKLLHLERQLHEGRRLLASMVTDAAFIAAALVDGQRLIKELEAHHEVAKLELEEAACGQLEDDADVR